MLFYPGTSTNLAGNAFGPSNLNQRIFLCTSVSIFSAGHRFLCFTKPSRASACISVDNQPPKGVFFFLSLFHDKNFAAIAEDVGVDLTQVTHESSRCGCNPVLRSTLLLNCYDFSF